MSQKRGIISYLLISLHLLSDHDISSHFIVANRRTPFFSQQHLTIWGHVFHTACLARSWGVPVPLDCMASQDTTNSASLESFQAAAIITHNFITHITRCGIYPSFMEITNLKKEIAPAKLTHGLNLALI